MCARHRANVADLVAFNNKFMKKKKIIIIIVACLVVILAIFLTVYLKNRAATSNHAAPAANFTPDYLNSAEISTLGLPSGTKVQALKRGANGEVMVYKVIRSSKALVNPSNVGPISPRAVAH